MVLWVACSDNPNTPLWNTALQARNIATGQLKNKNEKQGNDCGQNPGEVVFLRVMTRESSAFLTHVKLLRCNY